MCSEFAQRNIPGDCFPVRHTCITYKNKSKVHGEDIHVNMLS